MTSQQAQSHIDEARRVLSLANERHINDTNAAYCIGALIIALDQLADVVEDLAQREQGKVIA